jgi:hypothetical protein
MTVLVKYGKRLSFIYKPIIGLTRPSLGTGSKSGYAAKKISDFPAGGGKIANLFYSVQVVGTNLNYNTHNSFKVKETNVKNL